MRRVLAPLVCFFGLAGHVLAAPSAPFSFDFKDVRLTEFAGIIYGQVLHKDYVFDPSFTGDGRTVRLSVKGLPEDKVRSFAEGVLAQNGVDVREAGGVVYLRPSSSPLEARSEASPQSPPPVAPIGVDGKSQLGPDLLPEFFRYVPRYRTPKVVCDAVAHVFGPSSCFALDGSVQLVHAKHLSAVRGLAESVDAKLPSVGLELTFVEVNGSRRDGFGLSLMGRVLGGVISGAVGSPNSDGALLTIKGSNFGAVLDVLRTDSRFRQVSTPSGLVDSGQSFAINVGDEVPTLGGQVRDQTGLVTTPVVYRSSGVILAVTPTVLGDSPGQLISAAVDAQVSTFSATTTGVNGSPTLSKRQLKTSLSFAPGDVVVLGGLASSVASQGKGSLLGFSMGSRESDTQSDLVLVLSARIVQ